MQPHVISWPMAFRNTDSVLYGCPRWCTRDNAFPEPSLSIGIFWRILLESFGNHWPVSVELVLSTECNTECNAPWQNNLKSTFADEKVRRVCVKYHLENSVWKCFSSHRPALGTRWLLLPVGHSVKWSASVRFYSLATKLNWSSWP